MFSRVSSATLCTHVEMPLNCLFYIIKLGLRFVSIVTLFAILFLNKFY